MGLIPWHAVIVAGGSGNRFGKDIPKQFALLGDRPILLWPVTTFLSVPNILSMTIVCHKNWIGKTEKLIAPFETKHIPVQVVEGGKHRQNSCYNGIRAVPGQDSEIVLIHDAARPLVSKKLIENVITATNTIGAAIPAQNVKDSLVSVSDCILQDYLDRSSVKIVQTPQGFLLIHIRNAHKEATTAGVINSPDDACLMQRSGYPIAVVDGHDTNLKITTIEDLAIAEELLKRKKHS